MACVWQVTSTHTYVAPNKPATHPAPSTLCCLFCVAGVPPQIVYVAPMKALAAEVTANFGKRLAPLGLVVRELTGTACPLRTKVQ